MFPNLTPSLVHRFFPPFRLILRLNFDTYIIKSQNKIHLGSNYEKVLWPFYLPFLYPVSMIQLIRILIFSSDWRLRWLVYTSTAVQLATCFKNQLFGSFGYHTNSCQVECSRFNRMKGQFCYIWFVTFQCYMLVTGAPTTWRARPSLIRPL